MKITEIAKFLNGEIFNLKEDEDITSAKSIHSATKGSITFLSDKKLLSQLKEIKASAILVSQPVEDIDITQIVVKNPAVAFYKLIELLYPEEENKEYISPTAKIGNNVKIGKNCYISDYVVIEDNVEIGDNVKIYPFCFVGKNTKILNDVILYPNVTIYKDTFIGNRVIIHSGAVIAGDGFGYYQEDGKHKKIKHIGKVIIEDDVEIGANTTIDRALTDETIIKSGTKIDNLVMIGHNCKIGENSILVSQVGIAGSCNIGKNVILAGQVGVADHINIGDNVIVTAKSGVGTDLPPNNVYGSGIPAIEWKKWKKILVYIYKLNELFKK